MSRRVEEGVGTRHREMVGGRGGVNVLTSGGLCVQVVSFSLLSTTAPSPFPAPILVPEVTGVEGGVGPLSRPRASSRRPCRRRNCEDMKLEE